MPTSDDTLLRLVRAAPLPSVASPTVIGVDDWAWKKGRRYGTIFCDLERRHAVDLLPDRSADAVATWLGTSPGVLIIARGRSDLYADYPAVVWPEPGVHVLSVNKDETYTVEGINADLRTYLGRLKRRSRCFSRSMEKLEEAVRLFVWQYNRRRRLINAQPHLRHALPLLF